MNDEVFVIRNQLGQYWARSGEWVDGREPQRLLKQKHRDEAVNQLVELSAKDIDLRGEVLACSLGEKREPEVEVSEHRTPTLAEKAAAEAASAKAIEDSTANEGAESGENTAANESIGDNAGTESPIGTESRSAASS